MSIFDKVENSQGGYIFISHSHADIDIVRKIRNALEEGGFDPLCFYLKCLSDDSEIEDLIKREIDAREWFIFVDSPNSRSSKWVALEREHIKNSRDKKILTVNVEDDNAVTNLLYKIIHKLRVYVSYSRKDKDIAREIKECFIKKDYLVFIDEGIPSGEAFGDKIEESIIESSKHGCVALLITENSINSHYVREEIFMAIKHGANIVPIFVGDVVLPAGYEMIFLSRQHFFLPRNPTEKDIERVVDSISRSIIE